MLYGGQAFEGETFTSVVLISGYIMKLGESQETHCIDGSYRALICYLTADCIEREGELF